MYLFLFYLYYYIDNNVGIIFLYVKVVLESEWSEECVGFVLCLYTFFQDKSFEIK